MQMDTHTSRATTLSNHAAPHRGPESYPADGRTRRQPESLVSLPFHFDGQNPLLTLQHTSKARLHSLVSMPYHIEGQQLAKSCRLSRTPRQRARQPRQQRGNTNGGYGHGNPAGAAAAAVHCDGPLFSSSGVVKCHGLLPRVCVIIHSYGHTSNWDC